MNRLLLVVLLLVNFGVNAQITNNPRIRRKSTDDVFINKVVINDRYTIFYMQYNTNTEQQNLEEIFRKNPGLREKLERMPQQLRRFYLSQILGESTNSSAYISFQTNSYVRLSNGKRYNFIKVEGIPASPNRIVPEPGKKYYFTLYFEKIPPGYEIVDLVEANKDFENTMTYWNFTGISINNPAQNSQPSPEPAVVSGDFKLFGRVLDVNTNLPLKAKIVCGVNEGKKLVDSLSTSKSGYYEFLVKDDKILLKANAAGYENLDQSLDVALFRNKGSYEWNILLEPKVAATPPPVIPKTEPKIEPKKEEPKKEEPVIEKPDVGQATDASKSSFKLDKVYFAVGQAEILPDSYDQLEKLTEYLRENPKLRIQVEGHTDNVGDHALNQKLSENRAFNVRQYLIDHGIAGDRIKFIGYGDTKPVTNNGNEEAKKLNRRVEYKFIK